MIPSSTPLHRLIELAHAQRPAAPGLIIAVTNSADDNTAAQHTSWDLLTAGLMHLADGGIGREKGLLTTAISRASLRSAPLASALGIAAPVFKLVAIVKPSHSADAQAIFLARRLTEAVMNDIAVSVPIIERALSIDHAIDRGTRDYFTQLAEVHRRQCDALMLLIDRLPPSAPKPQQGGSFKF